RPAPALPVPSCSTYCVRASAIAINALLGTQSVSTQAPPRPSRSTTVTSAPSCAATSAASYPPGPPPMIAILGRGWLTLSNSRARGPARRRRPTAVASPQQQPGWHASPPAGLVRLSIVSMYAAYAGNLDPARMARRCPHSPQQGTGWLEGWRLTFGGEELGWEGALATVVEDSGHRVFVSI